MTYLGAINNVLKMCGETIVISSVLYSEGPWFKSLLEQLSLSVMLLIIFSSPHVNVIYVPLPLVNSLKAGVTRPVSLIAFLMLCFRMLKCCTRHLMPLYYMWLRVN
jgi:hypothetical protein